MTSTITTRAASVLAVTALALGCALPAAAQTTTVPGTMKSSPAGRDAQGHAADSTAPSTHAGAAPVGTIATTVATTDMNGNTTYTPVTVKKPRTNITPENHTPGAGNRNSGNAIPPTSGAAGR